MGGTGFWGTNLIYGLLRRGFEICVYSRRSKHLDRLAHSFPNVRIVTGNFPSESGFSVLLDGVDSVFHLISTTRPSNCNSEREMSENVLPTIRLLEACKNKCLRVIFFSSGGTVYGIPRYLPINEEHRTDPISAYGIQKLTIEKCLEYYGRIYGLDYIILRISNPYGTYQEPVSDQGVVAVFWQRL